MDRPEPLLERRCTHQRRAHHVAARFDIVRVRDDLGQILEHQPHALGADTIGQRMVARRTIGLEAMGEGVEAGAHGDEARGCRPSVPGPQ